MYTRIIFIVFNTIQHGIVETRLTHMHDNPLNNGIYPGIKSSASTVVHIVYRIHKQSDNHSVYILSACLF